MPPSAGVATAPEASAIRVTSRSRWSARSFGGFPPSVALRIASLSWATWVAIEFTSATVVGDLVARRVPLLGQLPAGVVERAGQRAGLLEQQLTLGPALPGSLATVDHELQNEDSCDCSPVVLGSPKVASMSAYVPLRAPSPAYVACSWCARDSRKPSRIRCVPRMSTPPGVPSLRVNRAGTTEAPREVCWTRWRE